MSRFSRVTATVTLFLSVLILPVSGKSYLSQFRKPLPEHQPAAFFYWNGAMGTDALSAQLKALRSGSGLGTLIIQPVSEKGQPVSVSAVDMAAFTRLTQVAKARKLALQFATDLSSETGFSGSKSLSLREELVAGPKVVYRPIPAGTILSVTGMDTVAFKRYDLTGQVYANRLKWHVPAGTFKVLYFYLPQDSTPDLLDAETAKEYVRHTYQPFFERYHALFGKTIQGGLTYGYSPDAQSWPVNFNSLFKSRFNSSPALLYPALKYTIGEETEAIRSNLTEVRSEAVAKAFPGVISQWAAGKGIRGATVATPEDLLYSGFDALKRFKYQDVPALKCSSTDVTGSVAVKLLSSSALNWGARDVLLDARDPEYILSADLLEKSALFAYSRGVTNLISLQLNQASSMNVSSQHPDAWKTYGGAMQSFNQLVARLHLMLSGTNSTLTDVVVLYGEKSALTTGQQLLDTLSVNYTFLHPEKLDEATVQRGMIEVNNQAGSFSGRLLIVPSLSRIALSNLKQIYSFYQSGGKVLFTGSVPGKATVQTDDQAVAALISQLIPAGDSTNTQRRVAASQAGGQVVFLPSADAGVLQQEISAMIQPDFRTVGNALSCLHTIREGKNVYFVVNNDSKAYAGTISFRGSFALNKMDPHTGLTTKTLPRTELYKGETYTVVDLTIAPGKSLFLVSL